MIRFMISAPGQIYLFGEQTILHEKLAVLASLNLRTFLKFNELPTRKGIINIEWPSIDLSMNLDLQIFKNSFYRKYSFDGDTNLLHDKVENFVDVEISNCDERQKTYLTTLLYLLVYIANKEQINIRSFHIHVTTELANNLALPGSVIVCFIACCFHWSRLQKSVDVPHTFDDEDLGKIMEYAVTSKLADSFIFLNETFVSIYGSVVLNQWKIFTQMISNIPTTSILLIDSKKDQSLLTQVKQVEDLKKLYPVIVVSVLNGIHAISQKVIKMLQSTPTIFANDIFEENATSELQIKRQQFSYLIRMHQELMNILDLSHPDLDIICSTARRYGLSAKCADMVGKFAYIWLAPDTPQTLIMLLTHDLTAKGYNVINTSVIHGGVEIE